MKIVSVIGARPQFIKAAAMTHLLRQEHTEVLLHTGQHYDSNMSELFFEDLGIPEPDVNLNVGSGPHGMQTGLMLARIEEILLKERPDWVLVYGDTNSTLAGALAACKLHIPVAHVEAGLRSFNRAMPEEINRVVTDHLSDLLFCPSQRAIDNLYAEGIKDGVYLVGDVMADSLRSVSERARTRSVILNKLDLEPGKYILVTLHRAENTDNGRRLHQILSALDALNESVIFPAHPRTRKAIEDLNHSFGPHVRLTDPVGYLDMIMLEKSARMILTDSGGVQKEAYWLSVPCITLRDETEWIETVESGWNVIAGADAARILHELKNFNIPRTHADLYGDGQAVSRCIALLTCPGNG